MNSPPTTILITPLRLDEFDNLDDSNLFGFCPFCFDCVSYEDSEKTIIYTYRPFYSCSKCQAHGVLLDYNQSPKWKEFTKEKIIKEFSNIDTIEEKIEKAILDYQSDFGEEDNYYFYQAQLGFITKISAPEVYDFYSTKPLEQEKIFDWIQESHPLKESPELGIYQYTQEELDKGECKNRIYLDINSYNISDATLPKNNFSTNIWREDLMLEYILK